MAKPRGPQARPPAWAAQPQREPHGPQKRICANEHCRRPYVPSERKNGVSRTHGLCPDCSRAVQEGKGYLLNPKLYWECQRIRAAEPKLNGKLKQAEYEAEQLAKLAKKPLRQPFIPSERGHGGKKGVIRNMRDEGAL